MATLDKEAVLNAIPDSWLDPILTGPDSALPNSMVYRPADIERVLRAVKKRIDALPEQK